MAKKGSIAAVLFVLIVGIVGAVFLYGGGSSETGAMLLENDQGSTTTTGVPEAGEKCECTITDDGSGKCKKVTAAGQPQPGGCCNSKGIVSGTKTCQEHCEDSFTAANKGQGKGKGGEGCAVTGVCNSLTTCIARTS